MNRVKTQDASAAEHLASQLQMSPLRQKQDKLAQKALKDVLDRTKNLQQANLKVRKPFDNDN